MGIIPTVLQKMTVKIDRTGICLPVSHVSRQSARDLYSCAVVD
jgi:hypothetical protein